jgi:hypothetical protein
MSLDGSKGGGKRFLLHRVAPDGTNRGRLMEKSRGYVYFHWRCHFHLLLLLLDLAVVWIASNLFFVDVDFIHALE